MVSAFREFSTKKAQDFAAALEKRILILDGAMGTMIQKFNLEESDFCSLRFANHPSPLKGNNDILVLTRPDVIGSLHRAFLDAGADIIETCTFSANRISQADYGLEDSVVEINREAVRLAREVADEYTAKNPEKPRFVAGSIGPTNRTASISPDVNDPAYREVDFDKLVKIYTEQVEAIIEAGVDILLVETIFDTLNAKSALFAIRKVFEEKKIELPIMVSATITDKSGRTLSGQTLEAFWYSIEHAKPISVGINCALGIKEMAPYVEELSKLVPCAVSLYANAGLPNAFGEYDHTPEIMAEGYKKLAQSGCVNICGGCCGTSPEHIKAIANAVEPYSPRVLPKIKIRQHFSGLEPMKFTHEMNFIMVGERTNITGSPKFARLIRENNFEEALIIARQQVENGANIIDINMDEGMIDSKAVMVKFLNLLSSEPEIAKVPIMIDSSRWDVIEAALKCTQGKSIVNSISLKEGEAKFRAQALTIRNYGASMIVMAFDEKGQADTTERRVEICSRAYSILVDELGISPCDIIFDLNVFPVGTGMNEHRINAVSFIEATGIIKKTFPDVMISGGISNLSFSFRGINRIREAMHSVFLYHAIKAGLEMGIVNAGMLEVYDEIPLDLRNLVEDVVLNRSEDATEKLIEFAQEIKDNLQNDKEVKVQQWRELSLEERLSHALIKGIVDFIDEDIEEALNNYPSALSIIEGPLMAGINQVGILFGEGKMFLPQVVKSARVMKKAVSYMLPSLEADKISSGGNASSGRVLLATVKGDVHDIGKNILGVILACNNFEINDIGVMVSKEEILKEARNWNADIIGLSGLITPSLEEMVSIAEQMEKEGFKIPLMVGGATTSKIHTAVKIAPKYSGIVVHTSDASLTPSVVQTLLKNDENFINSIKKEQELLRQEHYSAQKEEKYCTIEEARENSYKVDWEKTDIAKPDFIGVKKIENISVEELSSLINWNQFLAFWKIKDKDVAKDELIEDAQRMLKMISENNLFNIHGVYGVFPANSCGDDIEIYSDEERKNILRKVFCLRQQLIKPSQNEYLSIADFIAPKGIKNDYIGAFAITTGQKAMDLVEQYKTKNDDYNAFLVQSLSDRLVEAAAEYLQQETEKSWATHKKIRPAAGYPSCPDLSINKDIFALLEVEKNTEIELLDLFLMKPLSSISGFYFANEKAHYFEVGKIQKDQVKDYAKRKNTNIIEIEKLLKQNLGYEKE